MESQQFDTLDRHVVRASSRRGMVQVGVSVLAAIALAAFGGNQDDVSLAKGRHHKHHHKHKKNKKRCPSSLPVTCGVGCCPSEFPLCCQNATQPNPDLAFDCAPSSASCCPVSQGGGYCSGIESKCCAPTTQEPFGNCTEPAGTCCSSALGGFTCPASEPVCCPPNPSSDPFSSYCCPAGQTCGPTPFSCAAAAGSASTATVGVRQQVNKRGHFSPR
jgi:hypothetical protein